MSQPRPSLCRRQDSVLLVVDIQERLAAAMPGEACERVFRSTGILAETAQLLGVPVFLSEQYPKGLGHTHPEVLDKLGSGVQRFEKTCFSCAHAEGFIDTLGDTRQVVMAGMEAHVCIAQTALDLASAGFEVFVAADAVCSRNPENHANAMARLRHAGVVVTNVESVVFEWLVDARDEHFKAVSKLVR